MLDLYNNKYDMTTLKENIYSLKLLDILRTQIIDATFAVKYILNKKYQLHEDDEISYHIVARYQPHIDKNELRELMNKGIEDHDSVINFETVSNS